MQQNYNITFSGIILFGFDHDKTKDDTQKLLKLSPAQVEDFFSGRLVVLKKNLPLDEAQKIKNILENQGLLVNIEMAERVEPSLTIEPELLTESSIKPINQTKDSTQDTLSHYAPPTAPLSSKMVRNFDAEEDAPSFFRFSLQGRYGRLNYLNMTWAIYGVVSVFGVLTALVLARYPILSMGIIYVAILPFMLFFMVRATSLRLHDLNKSAWYSLLLLSGLIPYVGGLISFGFGIYLMCARGTEGVNDYGTQPKKGMIVGLVLTCLVLIVFIFILALYSSVFLALFSSVLSRW